MSFGGASLRSRVTSVCGSGTAGGGEAGLAVSRIPHPAALNGIARAIKNRKRAMISHSSNRFSARNAGPGARRACVSLQRGWPVAAGGSTHRGATRAHTALRSAS